MNPRSKALSRVIGGKKAQENGAVAEGIVEAARHLARTKRLVDVRKVPTPMRYDGSKRAWVPSERSTVDGVGFVMATSNGNEPSKGTFVADEVKSVDVTAGPSVLLSRVETHQRDFLQSVHESGGVAVVTFVLLGVSRDMLSIWRWYDICDESSISIERLRARAVSVNGYGGEVRACWLRYDLSAARLERVGGWGDPAA